MIGHGHVYQGRFKSFAVQDDAHLLTVARYVERNALRAGLVQRAEAWRWCSLCRRECGSAQERGLLSEWPVSRPADWVDHVYQPQTDAEVERVRLSVRKARPFGSPAWQQATADRLGLRSCFRDRGRPRRTAAGGELS